MTLRRTLQLVREDLLRRAKADRKAFNWFAYVKMFTNPHVAPIILFRVQCLLHANGLPTFAGMLKNLNALLFKCDLASEAEIGGGLFFAHAQMIVIGAGCRLGRNCVFAHNNTLLADWPPPLHGGLPRAGTLVLEDGVVVGAGARVLGALTVGARSVVGMNAVLRESVPPLSLALGVPARVVRVLEPDKEY